MIKRIDIFLPPQNQYHVLHHITQRFYESLTRLGVHCRILEAKFNDPKPFLQQIFNDPPDFTLSFNGLLPDENGYFFSDLIQIPHIACLTDPAPRFIELAKSQNTIITCMDSSGVDFFHELHFSKVFFMPHGAEKNLKTDPETKRDIDLLLLSTCMDYNETRQEWSHKYSPALCRVLDEAAERTLSDQTTSHIQAFVQSIDHCLRTKNDLDPNTIPYIEALMDLDDYVRGKDRIALLHSIKDFPVDIYGSGPWEKFISNTKAKIHTPVPYDQALQLMARSKFVLNSCPTTKSGTHTRVLGGAISGAVAVTAENAYTQSFYKDMEDILYYRYNELDNLNDKIGNLLADDSKRISIASNGMKITLDHHTWDHRASQLLKNLSSIM